MTTGFRSASRTLLYLSGSASFLYFATIPWPGAGWRVAAKGLSVAPLALVAWRELPPGQARALLAGALALGSLGDVLLDLSPELFTAGLGAFLVGHLLYLWLWTSHWRRPLRPGRGTLLRAALVLGACAALAAVLTPRLGGLAAPVILYMAAISAMAAASAVAPFASLRIFWGAALFVFSDAVIALDKFHSPVPARGWLVWSTYYAAQWAILTGYLRERGLAAGHEGAGAANAAPSARKSGDNGGS